MVTTRAGVPIAVHMRGDLSEFFGMPERRRTVGFSGRGRIRGARGRGSPFVPGCGTSVRRGA